MLRTCAGEDRHFAGQQSANNKRDEVARIIGGTVSCQQPQPHKPDSGLLTERFKRAAQIQFSRPVRSVRNIFCLRPERNPAPAARRLRDTEQFQRPCHACGGILRHIAGVRRDTAPCQVENGFGRGLKQAGFRAAEIRQVALDNVNAVCHAVKTPQVTGRADERRHGMAFLKQRTREEGTDMPGCSGYQAAHVCLSNALAQLVEHRQNVVDFRGIEAGINANPEHMIHDEI